MKVRDVAHGSCTRLSLRLADGLPPDLERGDEVVLLRSSVLDQPLLRFGERAAPVQAASTREADALDQLVHGNLPRLAWAAALSPAERTVVIEVHQFAESLVWIDRVEIGVDDQLVDDARKRRRTLRDRDEVLQWLADEFILAEPGRPARLLISGSPLPQAELHRAFRIHGARWNLDVITRDDGKLAAHRLTAARGDDDHPITLIECDVAFVDLTVAGAFVGAARSELDQLVKGADSYLGLWREYNAIERESVLRRARSFGIWPYHRVDSLGDGRYRVYVEPDIPDDDRLWSALRTEDLELALAREAPPELRGHPSTQDPRSEFLAIVRSSDRRRRTLDLQARDDSQDRPEKRGELYASLIGDRVRLDRRDRAFRAIASARCPMPQLGLILEGRDVPERRRRDLEPLSPAVLRVFGGTPTPKQREALRVALNTPDIALIQGPPGTGKTRTIAALQVRLAELAGEHERVSRQILLTSFQHDAVENVANKTRVLGLPALKLGGRRNETREQDTLDTWREGQIEALRADLARGGERPIDAVLRQVRARTIAHCQAPSPRDDPARLLDEVAQLAGPHLPGELLDALRRQRDDLRRPRFVDDADREGLRRAARWLRTDATQFADDGPTAAMKALLRLEPADVLRPAEILLLRRAADAPASPPEGLLTDLARLQADLLDRLAPPAAAAPPTVNVDVERLLHRVLHALHTRARESAEGIESALRDHLDDLEHDPEGVREAVLRYTAVLAATCQQAVSRPIQELKDEGVVFDTVIVDEAARANPLDLMIPMASAERRIILVGDHRQLPHLLEPDVEQSLDQGCEAATREALRRSLFERLFLELRRREHADGVRRTVTLDRQYRMHPVLGAFVSDTFYREHGEGFDSGTDPAALQHGLHRYGDAVAAWIDVPLARGAETPTRSKSRPCEAEVVAEEAHAILAARPDLSVGVISFYADQVDEILRRMIPRGLAERTDDGFEIRPEWARTPTPGQSRERLRVGTVDAFQGMEFDVVLLSMTRANSLPCGDNRALRRKYGHLMLTNRLCVAMSRQQRLLIVVGDRAMLAPPAAQQELRGLVAFSRLCEGPHGLVHVA